MSCGSLTYGFDYECNDGIGGVKPGTILITQWDGITAHTVTLGELTAITAGTWFKYEVRKFIPGKTTNAVNDPKQGTVSYTSTFTFNLFNLSKSKNVNLQLLMSKPLAVIFQDNNDIYHIVGLNYGAEATTIDSMTGVDKQDMNGYNLTIVAEDKEFPPTVLASVVTGLTVSGALS